MTVTFLDPQYPSKLPSRQEVLDFSIDSDVTGFTMSLLYPSGFMETIYQGGMWGQFYKASTLVGSTFHVQRAGGWPVGRFSLPMTEQTVAHIPALMDATGARAAWAFDELSSGGVTIDRTGNGNTLALSSAGGGASQPDIIPGARSYYIYTSGTIGLLSGDSAFAYGSSAFTVALRVSFRVNGGAQFLLGNTNGDGSGLNTNWELWLNSAGKLEYRYGANGASAVSSLTLPLVGPDWTVVSLRRSADRLSATLGVGSTYDTVTVPANSGFGSGTLRFGQQTSGAGKMLSGFKDAVIWDGLQTDEQITANVKKALGLP